ncbi:MAG TPA: TonB-dependent receptor [Terriglobia bacterium]|nr:TonB-dependent receptor [Terriglobia bacterium]
MKPLLVAWLLVLVVPVFGFSQAGTGQIQGVCLDPEGAAIPGVTVTIRETQTGTERVVRSDETGRFAAPFMPVGTYSVLPEYTGMVPRTRTELVLSVGATVDVTVDMVPRGIQQEVTVVTEAPALLTSQTEVSSTLNSLAIQNLPINGRRWENFVLLTPGVTNDGTFGLVSFHGIAGVFNNTMIDGADNNQAFFAEERGRTRIPYAISQETIREFQVKTSTFSAEYGRAAGGIVNAVTKSGTNEFHGSAFYYLRDRSFLARDPFARAQNQAKPPERRHQFGGSAGGPIARDKVFFFASYDQQNRNFPVTVLPNGGDNFYLGSTAPAGATQQATTFLRSLTGIFPRKANQNLAYGKVDFQINDRQRLTSSVNILDFRSPNGIQTANVVAVPVGSNGQDGVRNETSVTTLTSVLSPSSVNEVRFQYSRDFEFQNPNGPGPSVTINNGTGNNFQYGMPNFLPRPAYPNERRLQFVDNFSFLRRQHDFRFGTDINVIRDIFANIFQGGGVYAYTSLTNFALDYGAVDTGANTGKHYNTFTQAFDLTDPQGRNQFRGIDYNFYAQDNWRAASKLTLNLGVRYEYQQIPQPRKSNPALPLTAQLHQDKNNFGPRVGLAWQMMQRTVFRLGYGLSYGRTEHSTLSNLFVNNGVTQLGFQLNPATNLAGSPVFPSVLSSSPAGQQGSTTINLAAPDFVNPAVHQASAEIETQIGSTFNLSVRYLMARGLHLPFSHDTNIAPATQTRTYNVLDAAGSVQSTLTVPFYNARINPAFGQLLTYETGVSSWYHAMMLQANKRFGRGIQFMTSFTWSHATDDGQNPALTSTFLPTVSVLDPFNRRADYGNSVMDQRKQFVFSGLWQPQINASGFAKRALLGGWKFGGIVMLSDGFPQTGIVSLTNLAGGLGSGLNAAQSTNNRFPGIGRNAFRRPGLSNVDLRVAREFRIRESKSVEFLVEGFNIFNHVNYSTVNTTQYTLQGTNLVPNPLFLRPQAALSYPAVGNPRQLQVATRFNF